MGIKNGLAGLDAGPDWRGPVADRMFLPTADGGGSVTDAVSEAFQVAAIGRKLSGSPEAVTPKGGTRYHFSLPGSLQGFRVEDSPECRGAASLSNEPLPGPAGGARALAIHYSGVATARACRVATATFVPPDARAMPGYSLVACPRLYPGQTVRARVIAGAENSGPMTLGLQVRLYGAGDAIEIERGPAREMKPGETAELEWTLEETPGSPIFEAGIEISSAHRADGTVYLDYLTWDGIPAVTFQRPAQGGEMWIRSWTPGVNHLEAGDAQRPFRVIQDEGAGIAIQGTREWKDYRVSASLTPRTPGRVGLAIRAQGQSRFVMAALAPGGYVRLVLCLDRETVLDESPFPWRLDETYRVILEVSGTRVTARLPGGVTLTGECDPALDGGAAGIFCEAARVDVGPVQIQPV
jgi:hypothetical protein